MDGQLKHRAEAPAQAMSQIKRRFHAGHFRRGILSVVVAKFAFACHFVIRDDHARIEIGAGIRADLFMESFETTVRDRVVAVEEDDVLAPGVVDADVSGFGARSRARPSENPEPGIPSGYFSDDLLGLVFGCFNIDQTFPVLKRLIQDRSKTFLNVRLYVAAGDDK